MKRSLQELRKIIDSLDDQIFDLLKKRLEIADELAEVKPTLSDSKREENILQRITEDDIQEIYQEIFRITKGRIASKQPNRFAEENLSSEQ